MDPCHSSCISARALFTTGKYPATTDNNQLDLSSCQESRHQWDNGGKKSFKLQLLSVQTSATDLLDFGPGSGMPCIWQFLANPPKSGSGQNFGQI